MWSLPAAVLAGGGVATLAWLARALTPGGAAAAALVAIALLTGLGTAGGVLLLAFFLPATILSAVLERPDPDARPGPRTARQVLANGGPAAVAALAAPGPVLALWMASASLAAAAADTFATAIGTGSGGTPRDILTREPVTPGTSGGITLQGTLGGVLGAATVAAAAVVTGGGTALGLATLVLGSAWMLGDSLLGAALQGRFHCPACARASEARLHSCGTPTQHVGGLAWLSNDGVNLLAMAGAAVDAALWWWLWS